MKLIQLSAYSRQSKHTLNIKGNIMRVQALLSLLFLLIIFYIPYNNALAIEPQQKIIVKKVVDAFKQNNRVALSRMISYPLSRQAPLPPINNQPEFLKRYDEVFDRYLLTTITTSNLDTEWDSIGWQGVILGNGIIALDPEGNITEINHHSQREQALVKQLNSNKIAKGRRVPQRGATNLGQSIVELTTKNHHVRVDHVAQGGLRYSSWAIGKAITDKPEKILLNGRIIDGSGRNQRYVFDVGSFSYQLKVNSSGLNTNPTGSLEVFKNGKSLKREAATSVIRR